MRTPSSWQPPKVVSSTLALFWLLGGLCFSSLALGQYPVPSNAPSSYPTWWFVRGVVQQTLPTNSVPSWPSNYPSADDYSAINQGALKNLAAAGFAELQANLPTPVMTNSNALALQAMIGGWTNVANLANGTNINIQNPSFETPNVILSTNAYLSYQIDPTNTGWIFVNSAGIAANHSGWSYYQTVGTTNGVQYAFLQGISGVGAASSQTLSNVPSGYYTINFTSAQRSTYPTYSDNSTNQTITVLLDGANVGSFTPPDQNWYSYQSTPTYLNSGNHVLTFTNLPVPGNASILFDNVSVKVANTSADGYEAVNQGQLKALAQQFYTILGSASYTAGLGYQPTNWTNGAYPWSASSNTPDPYLMANIGEAKNLFSFILNITNSTNLVPAWWANYYGITNATNLALRGDGLSILQAYQMHLNPNDMYNGSAPVLAIMSGNYQPVNTNSFSAQALVLSITDTNGNPYTNSPVTFTASGTGLLGATNLGTTNNTLTLRTGTNGQVALYAYMGGTQSAFSVTATAGASNSQSQTIFIVNVAPTAPGLRMWFEADQGISTNSGGVSSWMDQAGSNYTVSQTTSGLQPSLVTNALGGKPVVRFTGSQDLANASAQANTNLNSAMTMITVCSTTNPSAILQYSFSLGTWDGFSSDIRAGGYFPLLQSIPSSTFIASFGYPLGFYATGPLASSAGTYITEAWSLNSAGTVVQFYRNGAPIQAVTNSSFGVTNLTAGISIGGPSIGAFTWQGDVAEVLVYDHQLSTNEMAEVGVYIANKYGFYNTNASWPLNYSAAVQSEIAKHQWNKAQADSYVAFQSNNPTVPTTGLSVWFKADAGVTTSGSNVTSWTDQTPNAYVLSQSTSASQPVLTNTLNGKPALGFSGAQVLANSATSVDPGLNADMTMITVSSTTQGAGPEFSFSMGIWSGWTNYIRGDRSEGYFTLIDSLYATNTFAFYGQGPGGPFNQELTVEGWSLNGALNNVQFYRNGNQIQSITNSTFGISTLTSGMYVGSCSLGAYDWTGTIAEVLVYDHQLSAAEWAQVSYYLGTKYSIPVALQPPTITPNGGSNATSMTVSMSEPVAPSAQIRYTLDGSTPINTSPLYSGPLTLTNSALVTAACFINGAIVSPTASAQFYVADSGNIGISDAWQLQYFGHLGINPNTTGINGLTYLQDYEWGYNPNLYSSNGDGLSDYLNHLLGYAGNNFDINGDGLTNAQDIALGLSPFVSNPGYTTAPPPNPSDLTLPVITLTQPTGATTYP